MSWHADTIKDKTLSDQQESEEVKGLIRDCFVPAIYVKWSLVVFKYRDEYKAIKGKRHLLIEMQDIATGKAPEEVRKGMGDIALSQTLMEILKEKPLFPDDDSFLRKLIHLVQATPIASPVGKAEKRPPRAARYEPGDMVLINKGKFFYGEGKEEKEIKDDYYLDVFPVTNKQYIEFIHDLSDYTVPYVDQEWAKPYNWDKEKRTFPLGKENHPVVLVSYDDAIAYCRWRTKKDGLSEREGYRLPNEQEWEKAARGDDGSIYHWGDEFDKEKCNTIESGISGTTEVTSYPEGASPYGCQDMVGNVWEWTDSWFDEDQDTRVLRGGSWSNYLEIARCADRVRYYPSFRISDVGFRCSRTLK